MNEKNKTHQRINQYLDAVQEKTSGLSPDIAESIINDLREHIETRLQSYGDQPTVKEVEAVLAEMDPPESFAPDYDEAEFADKKVSRTAIFGALLLPFGIILAILSMIIIPGAPGVAWWQWVLRFTIIPLGIISPFATTILGIVSLSQIRASKGKLIGKPLAVLDLLFYPILILDVLLIAGLITIFATGFFGITGLNAILLVLSVLIVLAIDFIIIVLVWRAVR